MLVKEKQGIIITLVDIISFFDREDIGDVLQTLFKIGVNKKAARIWFKLNEATEISVKTATGISESKVVGNVVGQGSAGAALVSQVNLDNGLMEYFEDSNDEIQYGGVRMQPLAYQDDILRGSKDVLSAQVGNIKLSAMLDEKGLEAHPDKTCFIVCGNTKYKETVKKNLENNPLMFGDFRLKQRESDRYLGQVLHGGGLDMSAEATVQERVGRIKGATMEIKGIIEDFKMQNISGMMAAWELWERALIPSLLSGSGTWFGLKTNTKVIDICDNMQNFFWRVMLAVPESCPKIALRCETGMMGMKWRIWSEKLLLLSRIRSQEKTSLSRQVFEECKARGLPGLGEEVTDICKEIGIEDVNVVNVAKHDIKGAIWNHHQKDIKTELTTSKKLKEIQNEDFSEVQGYFSNKSVETTRLAFRIRSKMVADIPGNYKNKYKHKGDDGLICTYCTEKQEMDQAHCLHCPAWSELRAGLDMTSIMDLVVFFRKLLTERARIDDVQKTSASHFSSD